MLFIDLEGRSFRGVEVLQLLDATVAPHLDVSLG